MAMNQDKQHTPDNHKIFVFGSNEAGIHGAGAALYAKLYCGAIQGQGVGLQGRSYAIPTKDHNIQTLPLPRILDYVLEFRERAQYYGDEEYFVSALGTGYAGYKVEQIAPMFRNSPKNVELPQTFRKYLDAHQS